MLTCLTTTVVHLQVTGDLSADCFILAVRRFISRRGQPKTIWIDNGTTFVRTNRELKTILSELNKSSSLINQKIDSKIYHHQILGWVDPGALL